SASPHILYLVTTRSSRHQTKTTRTAWRSSLAEEFLTFGSFSFLIVSYYNKRKTYFAHDALQQCTVGDIVLLKALPEPRSKHVKHELAEIVYKVGRVVDPLTGKSVAGTEFMEPLTDLPLSLGEETTLTEKLQELNISAASSEADSPPTQTPTS
uniref:Mitochondrial ribosomal protein S17 n=1 Tax=Lates calcarifer TaxID=8187 RepID=A0A4W6F5T0_LATCA